jgi:hypothetical protein
MMRIPQRNDAPNHAFHGGGGKAVVGFGVGVGGFFLRRRRGEWFGRGGGWLGMGAVGMEGGWTGACKFFCVNGKS